MTIFFFVEKWYFGFTGQHMECRNSFSHFPTTFISPELTHPNLELKHDRLGFQIFIYQ